MQKPYNFQIIAESVPRARSHFVCIREYASTHSLLKVVVVPMAKKKKAQASLCSFKGMSIQSIPSGYGIMVTIQSFLLS